MRGNCCFFHKCFSTNYFYKILIKYNFSRFAKIFENLNFKPHNPQGLFSLPKTWSLFSVREMDWFGKEPLPLAEAGYLLANVRSSALLLRLVARKEKSLASAPGPVAKTKFIQEFNASFFDLTFGQLVGEEVIPAENLAIIKNSARFISTHNHCSKIIQNSNPKRQFHLNN